MQEDVEAFCREVPGRVTSRYPEVVVFVDKSPINRLDVEGFYIAVALFRRRRIVYDYFLAKLIAYVEEVGENCALYMVELYYTGVYALDPPLPLPVFMRLLPELVWKSPFANNPDEELAAEVELE